MLICRNGKSVKTMTVLPQHCAMPVNRVNLPPLDVPRDGGKSTPLSKCCRLPPDSGRTRDVTSRELIVTVYLSNV